MFFLCQTLWWGFNISYLNVANLWKLQNMPYQKISFNRIRIFANIKFSPLSFTYSLYNSIALSQKRITFRVSIIYDHYPRFFWNHVRYKWNRLKANLWQIYQNSKMKSDNAQNRDFNFSNFNNENVTCHEINNRYIIWRGNIDPFLSKTKMHHRIGFGIWIF